MEYLKSQKIEDAPEFLQSGSGFPLKENIAGGFNTYDNVLKLVSIEEIELTVPEITLVDGSGTSSSTTETIYHELTHTPFVEVEWSDPSFTGSGGNVVHQYLIDLEFNDLQINVTASIQATNFIDATEVIPATTIPLRFLVFDLNTKRRLDTYIK